MAKPKKFIPGRSPLKQLREALGVAEGLGKPISQQEFAYRLKAGIATISRWERGEVEGNLSLIQIKALKQMLDQVGWRVEDLPDTFGPQKVTRKRSQKKELATTAS